ncbi:MAG: hypothetical protein JKY65_12700 [Planctomycetes bacterium]|nr:hypothetical protein [Planctomycetota bacterium]
MSSETLEAAQAGYRELCTELELALAHAKTVLDHLEASELARAGAHGFAVAGHLEGARRKLADLAIDWAAHSKP